MPIHFQCPHCDLPLSVHGRFSGAESTCLKCREPICVPTGDVPVVNIAAMPLDNQIRPVDYRKIAVKYRERKLFWLFLIGATVFQFFFFIFLALRSDEGAPDERTMVLILSIPLCLLATIILGIDLWFKKRRLRKGGYDVGFLGTKSGEFRIECPTCNMPFSVYDCFSTTPDICPSCQTTVIPSSAKTVHVSSNSLQSPHWEYDYRSIVRWERRLALSSFFMLTGFIACFSIIMFLFFSRVGEQSLFVHQFCMILALFSLGTGIVSTIMMIVSMAKLVGLLHYHFSVILMFLSVSSVVGIFIYLPALMLSIKMATAKVLQSRGYQTAFFSSGMEQFGKKNPHEYEGVL